MKLRVGESRGLQAGFRNREELKPGYGTCHGEESSMGIDYLGYELVYLPTVMACG